MNAAIHALKLAAKILQRTIEWTRLMKSNADEEEADLATINQAIKLLEEAEEKK